MKKNQKFLASILFFTVVAAFGVTCRNNDDLDTKEKCEKEMECKWTVEGTGKGAIGYCEKK